MDNWIAYENEPIQDDIIGRLRNTQLKPSQALLPVYEAIINSFQSLEEIEKQGKISIQIERTEQFDALQKTGQGKSYNLIKSITITDNGPGFDDKNYKSFITADSRHKESKGCKGVGRFVWLKAFEEVLIESIFSSAGEYHQRRFRFQPRSPAIYDHTTQSSSTCDFSTSITLKEAKKGYQERLPVDTSIIAQKIIEHCIFYLLDENCPDLTLSDPQNEEFIDLKSKLQEEIVGKNISSTVKIGEREFKISYIYLKKGSTNKHKISLCADGREVLGYNLQKYIPDIKSSKIEIDGHSDCTLLALVKSEYLDEIVNPERTSFAFASDSDAEEDAFDLSESTIIDAISNEIQSELESTLTKIKSEKIARFTKFIEESEPEYRVLLKHARCEVEKIPAGVDDYRLDTELHKILHKMELELKDEGREFISPETDSTLNNPEYKERYDNYVEKLLDYRQSELSKYVLHRKTIIDLLGKLLQKKDDDKYSLEEEIHKLLYPMRTSSDDIEFGQQNLWLIDEKLTYHYYLSSDLEFSRMNKVSIDSDDRPDLLVLDRPSSFAEGDYPHQSIVIIELKRPQRKNYPKSEKDPFDQVYGYIGDLKNGKVIGDDGVHVEVPEKARFYCYIIADLTAKMRNMALQRGFTPTIDNDGYYSVNPNYNAYIEIISYRKLYEDAKKRNRVLFEKLGLPTR